jgi:uncharacterized membrane protein YobD (UPF0266 family)
MGSLCNEAGSVLCEVGNELIISGVLWIYHEDYNSRSALAASVLVLVVVVVTMIHVTFLRKTRFIGEEQTQFWTA